MVAECRKMVVNTEHMHAHIDRHMDMHACTRPFMHMNIYAHPRCASTIIETNKSA